MLGYFLFQKLKKNDVSQPFKNGNVATLLLFCSCIMIEFSHRISISGRSFGLVFYISVCLSFFLLINNEWTVTSYVFSLLKCTSDDLMQSVTGSTEASFFFSLKMGVNWDVKFFFNSSQLYKPPRWSCCGKTSSSSNSNSNSRRNLIDLGISGFTCFLLYINNERAWNAVLAGKYFASSDLSLSNDCG